MSRRNHADSNPSGASPQANARNSSVVTGPRDAPSTKRPRREADSTAGRSWRSIAWRGAIVVLGLVIYSNSYHVPFLFDDVLSIVENRTLRDLGSWHVFFAPPSALTLVGRPVANVSFALNWAWGQWNVAGYHAVNMAVHLACGLVLFDWLRRTLQLPAVPADLRAAAVDLAGAVALIWTVHPLQTESVTYIVQRTESLATLEILAALWCALRALESPQARRWWWGACVACWLGIGTKETAVVIPVLVAVYDRVFWFPTWSACLRARWGLYLALASSWFPLAWLVSTTRGRGNSAGFHSDMTPLMYLKTQLPYVLHYMRLTVWPRPLIFDYGTIVIHDPRVIAGGAAGVLAVMGSWAAWARREPWLWFFWVFFACLLAPTSSIVPLFGQIAAERRMYLPLAAVWMVLVVAGFRGWRWFMSRSLRPAGLRLVGGGLFALVVIAYCVMTHQRNFDYRSTVAIWQDTLRKRPDSWRALGNTGQAYLDDGQIARAIPLLERAVALNPAYAVGHSNLGVARVRSGQFAAGIEAYNRSLAVDKNPIVFSNRGTAYLRLKDYQRAFEDYDRSLKIAPDNCKVLCNRADALRGLGRCTEALRDAEAAVQCAPDLAETYWTRGATLACLKRTAEAAADLDRFVDARQMAPESVLSRAKAWAEAGYFQRAWQDIEYVRRLGLTPDPDLIQFMLKAEGRKTGG